MANHTISQDDVNNLVQDATYLKDEAEAMQYVIDNVPYDETPPNGPSIAEMLLLMDHAQLTFYRPIVEDTVETDSPTHLDEFEYYEETFEYNVDEDEEGEEESELDIQKVLTKLAKHRAGFVNLIEDISLIDWEAVIYKDEKQISLYHFVGEMVQFERNMLNKIAEQVMAYSKDQERQREIESRRDQRKDDQQPNP